MPITQMTTSAAGRAFLRREEGCVLRAYRDVTGTWTIGDGLTAASGVVTPKAGMVITQAEADRLFALALARNYEPAVRRAMPGAAQHEFDAGVSFHWNAGAIGTASWVGLWKQGQWVACRTALLAWNRSKGRVISGLTARRGREFALLRDGKYGVAAMEAQPSSSSAAQVSSALSPADVEEARAGLRLLGYAGGGEERISDADLRRFQRAHDLTADGILGRATLATIRRMVAARRSGKVAAGGASAAALTSCVSGGGAGWFDALVLGGAGVFAVYIAWTYRDAIAAAVQDHSPRLAAFLRRF